MSTETELLKSLELSIFGILQERQAVTTGKEGSTADEDQELEECVKDIMKLFNDPMKSKFIIHRRGWYIP